MVYESSYWKNELYNSYKYLVKFRHMQSKRESSSCKAEKAIMIGCYIIRKLDDAEKIPNDFLTEILRIKYFKTKSSIVDHLNWHRVDEHYDLENDSFKLLNIRTILNQIIHSFSFLFILDDYDQVDGILVNSDKTKQSEIYEIKIKDLLRLFIKISEGTIISSQFSRDNKVDSKGNVKIGEMHQTHAVYGYPINFNLEDIINQSMKGIVYNRLEEW